MEALVNNQVVLLNPNWRMCGVSDSVRYFPVYHPVAPLELLYIKGSLERKGMHAVVLDLWMKDSDIKHHQGIFKECAYVVITTAPTYLFWRDGATDVREIPDVIKEIKTINPQIKSILIGPQGTSVPQMVKKDNVDFIIRGEPDLVLADFIIEDLSSTPDYSRIDGVCYRSDEDFIYSSKTAVVDDMSTLPTLNYPDESLIARGYPDSIVLDPRLKSVVYEASRGCVYSCIFCWRDGFRDKYRTKDIFQIEKEISSLVKKGVEYLYFIDETFGVKRNWTNQVLNILKKYKIKWACQTNPNVLSTSFIDKISECGCIGVELGLENIDTQILRGINKKFNLDEVKSNIKSLLAKKDIKVVLFLILGGPGDKKGSSINLFNFVRDMYVENLYAEPTVIAPLPNTPLWRLAQKQGAVLNSFSDIGKFAGIVDNEYTKSIDVWKEVYKLKALLRCLKFKHLLKKSHSIKSMVIISSKLLIYHLFASIPLLYLSLVKLNGILISYKISKR